jgi:hypothetical protein
MTVVVQDFIAGLRQAMDAARNRMGA